MVQTQLHTCLVLRDTYFSKHKTYKSINNPKSCYATLLIEFGFLLEDLALHMLKAFDLVILSNHGLNQLLLGLQCTGLATFHPDHIGITAIRCADNDGNKLKVLPHCVYNSFGIGWTRAVFTVTKTLSRLSQSSNYYCSHALMLQVEDACEQSTHGVLQDLS